MNEKSKFLVMLILAVISSSITSYVTTRFSTTMDVKGLVAQEVAEQLSHSKVTLPYEVSFFAAGNSLVTAYSKISLENLTIVYKYAVLEDGATVTKSIDYGTFIPAWGAGAVIKAGATPEALYKIPDDIIQASSTTKVNDAGCLVFDTPPQLEVLEVYGYA
jgi:hypothetical protein